MNTETEEAIKSFMADNPLYANAHGLLEGCEIALSALSYDQYTGAIGNKLRLIIAKAKGESR